MRICAFILIFLYSNASLAGVFYRDYNYDVKLQYIGLSSTSFAIFPQIGGNYGTYTNNLGIDYGVIFGNKGGIFLTVSPGSGFGLDINTSGTTAVNYIPFSLYGSGKINYVTLNNFSLFSEIGIFGQIISSPSNTFPYGLIWHQVGIGYNIFLPKTIISMSTGFLQYITATSQDVFKYTSQSLVIVNENGVGGDFKIGAMISASAIYNVAKNISLRIAVDYILPFPIVANPALYFSKNNMMIFSVGIRYVW
jgi:hypothetical protein